MNRSPTKSTLIWWVTGLAFLVISAIGIWTMAGPAGKTRVKSQDTAVDETSESESPRQVEAAEATPYELTDSAQALWARSENGQPIDLRFMPMGVQAIVRLRLAKLIAHPESERILRSLGPEVQTSLRDWFQQVGVDGTWVETLTIGLLPQGSIWPESVVVAVLTADTEMARLQAYGAMTVDRIATSGENAFWFPEGDQRTFVFGPADIVHELRIKGDSSGPLLRRELEHLRLMTHDTDHVTVLANPNFLRDEAQGLFTGQRRPLLHGLYDFWGEHAQAVSLGLQLNDVALIELRMIAREEWLPLRLSAHVHRQIDSLPSRVSDILGHIRLDPYWQPLALRFPAMLRFATERTRVAVEGRQVAISTALPVAAVHNLLLASELTLASPANNSDNTRQDRSRWTMQDVLDTPLTVRFAQRSLEFAIRDVARQVRDDLRGLPFDFAIEIMGTDLQPEGITRNQQIHDFNQVDRPLSDILTVLVRMANPVPNVTNPSDPEQKLVWVVEPGDSRRILITTRTAAAGKHWELPPGFLD